ncbi:hypothetical protein T484DRAFT_1840708 [Baffinella frigidus]|nr:hypothetical protein T484DRAFT_1840708 [Cryptophyta sp. CCMP2293]
MSKTEWVVCPNGCGEKLFYRELTAHCNALCVERLEPCTSGCGAMVRFREKNKHKMMYCGCRPVPCK